MRCGNILAWCVVLCLSGCGGSGEDLQQTTRVEGTITLSGQPLAGGTIFLYPVQEGKHATGVIQNGKFTLSTYASQDGAIPGRHKVVVQVPEVTANGEVIPAARRPPAEYATAETTPLIVEVTEEGEPLKIEITN